MQLKSHQEAAGNGILLQLEKGHIFRFTGEPEVFYMSRRFVYHEVGEDRKVLRKGNVAMGKRNLNSPIEVLDPKEVGIGETIEWAE